MRQQLQQRLNDLKAEFTAGQKMLAEQETQLLRLRETLWRISGAMQVLEEALAHSQQPVQHNAGLAVAADSGNASASSETPNAHL